MANLREVGTKEVPCLVCLSIESRPTLRAMGEGPGHPSSLCGSLPFHSGLKGYNYCPYHRRRGWLLYSAWCSEGCSMRSSRVAICSKIVEPPTSTNRLPQGIWIEEGLCNNVPPFSRKRLARNTWGLAKYRGMAQRVQNLFKFRNSYN